MNKLKVNAKLLESLGLFLLLTGWFLNWQSVQYWNDADQKVDSIYQTVTTNYHQMQTTANVRFEASLSRALSQISYSENNNKIAWDSPEVRQRWLARMSNNLFSLYQFKNNLSQINEEYKLHGETALEESKKQLDVIRTIIEQSTNEKEIKPLNIPVPDSQILSLEKANETEVLSGSASESVFQAYDQIKNLVIEKKQSSMLLNNILFIIGSIFTVFAKFLEWLNDRGK